MPHWIAPHNPARFAIAAAGQGLLDLLPPDLSFTELAAFFAGIRKLTPAAVIADFRAASSGRTLEDASQFVRAYLTDLPKLEPLLAKIRTPER